MSQTGHRIKTPSHKTGLFAMLRACLPAHVGGRTLRLRLTLPVLGAVLAAALAIPGSASAHFTRPFLRQITETPAGPFVGLRGVAVDPEGNLWASEHRFEVLPFRLDEFRPVEDENTFLKTLDIEGREPPEFGGKSVGLTPPDSIAIDDATHAFYTVGLPTTADDSSSSVEVFEQDGKYLKRFDVGGEGRYVAFDNSSDPSDPSAGALYVAVEKEGGGIYKFDAAGDEVKFSGSAPYISGNEITGTPENGNFGFEEPGNVAVDANGDLYTRGFDEHRKSVVDEYAPSGRFIRAITAEESPVWMGPMKRMASGGILPRLPSIP